MKKRKIILVLMAAVLAFGLAGCKKEEVKETSKKTEEKEEEQDMISFVDVNGNHYETPVLEDVKKHDYDLSRLEWKDGYCYYTDEKGDIISKLGIDVSEYQPQVDWNQVKEAGISFAMIRLGYRGYGEAGTLVEDSMYRTHMENAKAAGIDTGVYFFSQAVSEEETKEEVQYVLDHIKDYEITCPVVFDTEEIKFDTARTDNLTGEQFTKNCKVFCDMIEDAGYDSMIYANMKWFAFTLDMEELEDYKKWYADYEMKPQMPYDFSMWQYTESGSVPGIDGNVDLNVWFPDTQEEEEF